MDINIDSSAAKVSVFTITQATTATLPDLFFSQTCLIFIQAGSKKVLCPVNGELNGDVGDLLIFPPNSIVTLENRSILKMRYCAVGVSFTDDLIETVFAKENLSYESHGIQILRAIPFQPNDMLKLIQNTLNDMSLPPSIKQHRLLEPLIWLQQHKIHIPIRGGDLPHSRVRRLIETNVSHPWRLNMVARHFAMSEATFRRWLAHSGHSFSNILLNTRLEKGLALLQTTDMPITQIALECGFKTPSHFSDSFRKRFEIKPKMIREDSF